MSNKILLVSYEWHAAHSAEETSSRMKWMAADPAHEAWCSLLRLRFSGLDPGLIRLTSPSVDVNTCLSVGVCSDIAVFPAEYRHYLPIFLPCNRCSSDGTISS